MESHTITSIGNEVVEEMEVTQHSSNALESPTYTGNEVLNLEIDQHSCDAMKSSTVNGNEIVMLGVNQHSNNRTLAEIKQNKTPTKRTIPTSNKKKKFTRKMRDTSYKLGQMCSSCVMPIVYKCDILSCGCYFDHRDLLIKHILTMADSHCGSIILDMEHSYCKQYKPHTYGPFHTKHVPESVIDVNGHSYSKAWTGSVPESDIECETIKVNNGCLSSELECMPQETLNGIIKLLVSEHDIAPFQIGASQK